MSRVYFAYRKGSHIIIKSNVKRDAHLLRALRFYARRSLTALKGHLTALALSVVTGDDALSALQQALTVSPTAETLSTLRESFASVIADTKEQIAQAERALEEARRQAREKDRVIKELQEFLFCFP